MSQAHKDDKVFDVTADQNAALSHGSGNDEQDAAQGGDSPYDSIVNGVPYDVEDYWTHVYPEIADGKTWQPVHGLEPFAPDSPPACGGQSTKGYVLFYCVPDDYVG